MSDPSKCANCGATPPEDGAAWALVLLKDIGFVAIVCPPCQPLVTRQLVERPEPKARPRLLEKP